jgi:hypothetical protein
VLIIQALIGIEGGGKYSFSIHAAEQGPVDVRAVPAGSVKGRSGRRSKEKR